MKEVRSRLFIGNLTDACQVLAASDYQVTHVLSVTASNTLSSYGKPLQLKDMGAITLTESLISSISANGFILEMSGSDFKVIRMLVPWKDTEDENILDGLESCLDFIDQGRQHGTVLVHCLAGISRSAAVVTAYLMKSEKLSLEAALASLRKASESACPNVGFLGQLEMFEDMGFKVDRGSSIYKRFHVEKLGEAYEKGERVGGSSFAADPAMVTSSSSSDPISSMNIQKKSEQMPDLVYRCKKCRRIVASKENVLTHVQGRGDASFKKKKKDNTFLWDERKDPECTSVFVEPLQWMKTVQEGGVFGKLSCTSCDARLGNFNWAGLQCSCGAWVIPAFQLHKSRIDSAGF